MTPRGGILITIEKVGYSTCASTSSSAHHALATLVLLYSRLTGLTNAFNFQYAKSSSDLAPSTSEPYLLRLPNDGPDALNLRANPRGSHRIRVSTIVLKALKYESPQGSILSGLGQTYFENNVVFYQLSVFTNDLALSECLYVEVQDESKVELCPPNTFSRLSIAKTPARLLDDFIVPDGYVDRDDEDSSQMRTAEKESYAESRADLEVLNEDPCTISFEWLENELHGILTDASPTPAFHENLELLQNEIEDKVASANPTMETLYVKYYDLKKASRTYLVSTGFAW